MMVIKYLIVRNILFSFSVVLLLHMDNIISIINDNKNTSKIRLIYPPFLEDAHPYSIIFCTVRLQFFGIYK